jgi:hypothetical protein
MIWWWKLDYRYGRNRCPPQIVLETKQHRGKGNWVGIYTRQERVLQKEQTKHNDPGERKKKKKAMKKEGNRCALLPKVDKKRKDGEE